MYPNSLTPAQQVEGNKIGFLLEYTDGDLVVNEEAFDEHPEHVGSLCVEEEPSEELAENILKHARKGVGRRQLEMQNQNSQCSLHVNNI